MAKSKNFVYKFRLPDPGETTPDVALNYRCEKWTPDGEQLLNTYHIWGDDEHSLVCDCPGAMYHQDRDGLHKHILWLQEYLDLIHSGSPSNIEYDTETERFREPPPSSNSSEGGINETLR